MIPLERILRILSLFGVYELIYALVPWWLLAVMIQIVWPTAWMNDVLLAALICSLMTAGVGKAAKSWSSRTLGLKRYTVIPIARPIAYLLVRGRMNLPKGKRYFLLHVRMERGLDPRRMAREMRRDIQHGLQAEWTKNAVFLGNTFGSLGRLQAKMLAERGCVEVVDGTFFPLQTLFLRPKRYQKRMFGRVWSEETRWKIIKFSL